MAAALLVTTALAAIPLAGAQRGYVCQGDLNVETLPYFCHGLYLTWTYECWGTYYFPDPSYHPDGFCEPDRLDEQEPLPGLLVPGVEFSCGVAGGTHGRCLGADAELPVPWEGPPPTSGSSVSITRDGTTLHETSGRETTIPVGASSWMPTEALFARDGCTLALGMADLVHVEVAGQAGPNSVLVGAVDPSEVGALPGCDATLARQVDKPTGSGTGPYYCGYPQSSYSAKKQVSSGTPFFGTSAKEIILGTPGPDEIHAGGGDDCIYGYDGSDTIYGDAGNDIINAGAGGDTVRGGSGKDWIDGDVGADFLYGEGETDIIYGGPHDDLLDGGSSPHTDHLLGDGGFGSANGPEGGDTLRGWQGKDYLYGQGGSDTLEGGDGPDDLWGAQGNDVLKGENGDDNLYGLNHDDTLIGGSGTDYGDGGAHVSGDTCSSIEKPNWGGSNCNP